MVGTLLLLAIGLSVAQGGYHDNCYRHLDHAAKYRLCHDDTGYPTNEINLVLDSHPSMKEMFKEDEHPATTPLNPYTKPPKSVCPYERYTLYSFFYANKDCYVIYPAVQSITYVQCSAENKYDCQGCSGYGGVSKCAADYDFRHVWAYCIKKPEHKPIEIDLRPDVTLQTRPVYRKPVQKIYYYDSPTRNDPEPPTNKPQPRVAVPYARMYRDPWNKMYRPYLLQHRWKRSYHTTPQRGTIERMKLYLPHHCGCKSFVC